MNISSLSDFERLADRGNLIPVFEDIHFDWETPISAFRKIDDGKFSFLLESVEGGEKWGRYSFLGSSPMYLFRSKGEEFEIVKDGVVFRKGVERDPLRALENFLRGFHPVEHDYLPRFFGGAVGYINYDVVKSFERIPDRLPQDLNVYSSLFIITDTLLVFDNLKQKVKVICNPFLDDHSSPGEAYQWAQDRIAEIISKLKKPFLPPDEEISCSISLPHSNLSPETFMEMVERAKKYIRAGDVIQVVLSQRFSVDIRCPAFSVYRALRSINPSPYLFYLKMGDMVLLGASPEVMVRLDGGRIELRPLAGTRQRGRTKEEDLSIEKDLLSDEKERAEHIMLVDLGRNDVGRVAEIGSVKVTELMAVERYSHVMHIVSNIQGSLPPGKNAFNVFRAAFPAGTVSGAPKIRAMEIIEELEPVQRGPYAGAVGYFGFSGNMDTCITIRSILIKDGKAYVQSGAGIVADSIPEREYEETLKKAKAVFKALEIATEGLR